ncbi:endoplasmic reticulum oxidoreductin 1, partial [Blyttiomyces helicus]
LQVNLEKQCPFWKENPLCVLRDCEVIEADEAEVPVEWRKDSLSSVDRNNGMGGFLSMAKTCEIREQDFCLVEDEATSDGAYVNLLKNPERFTGYAGESPARIWDAIYNENCFNKLGNDLEDSLSNRRKEVDDTCIEKRVFYRLVSGLHASISMHICDEYLDRKTGVWGPDLDCFINRIGNHPDRIQNMYFLYTVLVRAVTKLAPTLAQHGIRPFCTGTSQDEAEIEVRVVDLSLIGEISDTALSCEPTFDEKMMFLTPASQMLKDEFKNHFRNISRIMDCVGCEKCRLWGKLQVSGLGTALKVLFSYDEIPSNFLLTRGELVALFNAMHRLSESLMAVDRFRIQYARRIAADMPKITTPASLCTEKEAELAPTAMEGETSETTAPAVGTEEEVSDGAMSECGGVVWLAPRTSFD